MTFRDDVSKLTEHDRREVETFQRFLNQAGPAPPPRCPGGGLQIKRRLVKAGWLPYCLGLMPPPEGMDDVAATAWTLPA